MSPGASIADDPSTSRPDRGGSSGASRGASNGGARDGSKGALRIGEAAQACGVTTRTLRYWQEIGLLNPSGRHDGGGRLYSKAEVERAARIKELQELLGFSLSEIRAVLNTEDVLERLRSAYRASARPEVLQQLLDDAIETNDQLLARLDDTLERIKAFRDERAQKARRLRARARELVAETPKESSRRR
jgi:MerR family transcriptional regulator, repressor of the yfmOP operon